jgi:hypothetical protein
VLQGSTGPFTQMLGSLYLQAAVADSLHVACSMQHGQNQQWDNITQTLHYDLGNLLPLTMSSTEILEARLSSKPASGWHTHPVPHSSPSLHQHLLACLSTTPASPHNLDIEGIRVSLLLGQGQNFHSPLWKNLVKLILITANSVTILEAQSL